MLVRKLVSAKKERKGEVGVGVLLLIWAMVDRRRGPQRKNERGGGQRRTKNKRQMSRGSRVADRCDVQCGAARRAGSGSGKKKKKATLCDADDNAISPALSRPMGSAPGDIESQTLIRWVCVLRACS